MKRWQFCISSRSWKSPNRWRKSTSEIIHLNEERNKKFFEENQTGSSPTPIQDDSTLDDAEAENGFWSVTGDFILSSTRGTRSQPAHAERRIISLSDEVHWRWQNNTYITGCIVGETYWRLLDSGWRKRTIWRMERLHKIHQNERKATWWVHMVRRETDEEANNLKTRQCMARYVEAYVWCSEN